MTERDNSTPVLCNVIFRNIVLALNVKSSEISKDCEENGFSELEKRCEEICLLYEKAPTSDKGQENSTRSAQAQNSSEFRFRKLHESLHRSKTLFDAIKASDAILDFFKSHEGRMASKKDIEEVHEVKDRIFPSGFSTETIKKILNGSQSLKEYQITMFLDYFLNPYFLKHYMAYDECRDYILDMDKFLCIDKKTREKVYYPTDRQKTHLTKLFADYKKASAVEGEDFVDIKEAIDTFIDFLKSIFNFFLRANIKDDSIEEKENAKKKLQIICENTKEHKLACDLVGTEMVGALSSKELIDNAIYKGVLSFESAKKSSLILEKIIDANTHFTWVDAEKSSGYLTYLHWLYYSTMCSNVMIDDSLARKLADEVYDQYKTYISPSSFISDRSFIQQNCIIKDNARIKENVFLSGVVVEENAVVNSGSILYGNNIVIRANSIVFPNTIIINNDPTNKYDFDFQSDSLDESRHYIDYIELGYGVDNEKE